MAYESIDQLQRVLADEVFVYAQDRKKAAGRALGTLVEIINFYLLKAWGFEQSVAIERALPEFGNPGISHNVEYSLHPILARYELSLKREKLPIKSSHLLSEIPAEAFGNRKFIATSHTLISSHRNLRNSCVIGIGETSHLVATIIGANFFATPSIVVVEQFRRPYGIFECKRVGIEEGMKKGPQTIEKAKQGAYVARTISSLHKLRMLDGELRGIMYGAGGQLYAMPYVDLIKQVVASSDSALLAHFVLTVGVVSNHGNWFTSENHNKELKVLAQSYDWLLFLSDAGLAQFITDLLLDPLPELSAAREAFLSSYCADKKVNSFTKVSMSYDADRVLENYFISHDEEIERWFNVISPNDQGLPELRTELSSLRDKKWNEVHAQ
jgi:hypothetical protein